MTANPEYGKVFRDWTIEDMEIRYAAVFAENIRTMWVRNPHCTKAELLRLLTSQFPNEKPVNNPGVPFTEFGDHSHYSAIYHYLQTEPEKYQTVGQVMVGLSSPTVCTGLLAPSFCPLKERVNAAS